MAGARVGARRTTIDRGERERGVERGSGEPNRGRRVKTPDVIDRVLPWGGESLVVPVCRVSASLGGFDLVCQCKQPPVVTPVVRGVTGPPSGGPQVPFRSISAMLRAAHVRPRSRAPTDAAVALPRSPARDGQGPCRSHT